MKFTHTLLGRKVELAPKYKAPWMVIPGSLTEKLSAAGPAEVAGVLLDGGRLYLTLVLTTGEMMSGFPADSLVVTPECPSERHPFECVRCGWSGHVATRAAACGPCPKCDECDGAGFES